MIKLTRRIAEVYDMKIPLVVKAGNKIPAEPESLVVQLLDSDVGKIPEVKLRKNAIMDEGEPQLGIKPPGIFYKGHPYHTLFCTILVRIHKVNEEKLPEFFNTENTASYAIYDPVADMSYFYVLPNH